MTTFRIGDARPDFKFTVVDETGAAINLSGSSATTKIRKTPEGDDIIIANHLERAATPINLAGGRYDHYGAADGSDFEDGDDGHYVAWLDLILSDGDPLQTGKKSFKVVPPYE